MILGRNKLPTITKLIADFGIQAFFIVTDNGLPLLNRVYKATELGLEGDDKVESLTSMISTVVRFNQQLVKDGLLSDIGLLTSRIYFDYLESIIFVLMVDERSLLEKRLSDIQILLKGTISTVKTKFQAELKRDLNVPETLTIELLQEIFGKDVVSVIDEYVYSSYKSLSNALS